MINKFISLEAAERPKAIYRYTVTGEGPFPLDMLRYDSCWPYSQRDVFGLIAKADNRTVTMCSFQAPTIERWASFQWEVKAL